MNSETHQKLEYTDDPETWMCFGGFRVRPFLNKDHLLAKAAVRRLSRENTAGLSIISKVATAQALIYATMALELNERGIHALIGNSCSCGLGIEVERIRGDKPLTRAHRERLLFKLPAHLNTKTFTGAGVDLIRGVISWPKRSFWIQPAGKVIRTRWICWEKGELGLVWTEKQSAQLAKWRDQAATKAAQAAKTTEKQNERN